MQTYNIYESLTPELRKVLTPCKSIHNKKKLTVAMFQLTGDILLRHKIQFPTRLNFA